MTSHAARFPLVLVSVALAQPFADLAFAAEAWETTLTTAKDEVAPGEPVVIRWRLTNRSNVGTYAGDMAPRIHVSRDGQRFFRVDTNFRFFLRNHGTSRRLEPGESAEFERTLLLVSNRPMGGRGDLQWLIFPGPGEYVIRLEHSKFGREFFADTTLTVREPEGAEAEAWALYRNKGVLMTVGFHREPWLMRGGRRYLGVEGILDRARGLQDVLEERGDQLSPGQIERIQQEIAEREPEVRDLNVDVTRQRIERILAEFPDTIYGQILQPIHEDMRPLPGRFDAGAMWRDMRQRLEAEGYDVDAFWADLPDEYRQRRDENSEARRLREITVEEELRRNGIAAEQVIRETQTPQP